MRSLKRMALLIRANAEDYCRWCGLPLRGFVSPFYFLEVLYCGKEHFPRGLLEGETETLALFGGASVISVWVVVERSASHAGPGTSPRRRNWRWLPRFVGRHFVHRVRRRRTHNKIGLASTTTKTMANAHFGIRLESATPPTAIVAGIANNPMA